MSLEAKIEALTEQVTQLTEAVTVLKNVFRNAATMTALQVVDEVVERIAEPITSAHTVPNDQPQTKSKPTTDTSPPSSNESRTVTYDDVKNVTIAVSKIDKAKAVAGLARFGVTTAKALNEEQWLGYVVYMERVQKGEVDPEASHG